MNKGYVFFSKSVSSTMVFSGGPDDDTNDKSTRVFAGRVPVEKVVKGNGGLMDLYLLDGTIAYDVPFLPSTILSCFVEN